MPLSDVLLPTYVQMPGASSAWRGKTDDVARMFALRRAEVLQ